MSDDTWADESEWEVGAEDVAEAIEEAAAPPPVRLAWTVTNPSAR